MFNQALRLFQGKRADFLVKWGISVMAICLLAPISIQLSGSVDLTLQTLIILFVACVWGFGLGLLSTLTYIVLGTLGLPVFSGYSSGFEVVFGPHGGFFFGFLVAASVVGYFAERLVPKAFIKLLLLWIAGHLIILILGFFWLQSIAPSDKSLIENVLEFSSGVMIKSALGILLLQIMDRIILRIQGSPNPSS
ncbi:MAG: hypothetical protein HKN32_07580 [Flavobacteriales bacterium]|nr:hypothetical protein [Flavobacteriales bacterium]